MFSPVFGVHQVCTTTRYYRIPSLHAHLTNCHLGFLSLYKYLPLHTSENILSVFLAASKRSLINWFFRLSVRLSVCPSVRLSVCVKDFQTLHFLPIC